VRPRRTAHRLRGVQDHLIPTERAHTASGRVYGAASHFLLNQLPELYGGLQRDATSFPVQYLGANVPQAWAAGTPFMLLQAILGLQQDAPRGRLYVDPRCRIGCRT
jgi:glycogen debranching enzyme